MRGLVVVAAFCASVCEALDDSGRTTQRQPEATALLPPEPAAGAFVSVSGDPGLLSPAIAVMLTGWNFCNMALAPPEFDARPSPRWADCASPNDGTPQVSAADNALGPGDAFPLPGFNATDDANAYAVQKGLFLAQRCERASAGASAFNWGYHTVMWKSGNMDMAAGICPETSPPPPAAASLHAAAAPLRFNNLKMNQPLVALHPARPAKVPYSPSPTGGFVGWAAGTYDVNASWSAAEVAAVQAALEDYTAAWVAFRFAELEGASPLPPRPDAAPPALLVNRSYEGTVWWKNVSSGATVFLHMQATSAAAPWLMSYYKLMDAAGFGSGYDWAEGGQVWGPVPAFSTKLRATYTMLDRSKGGFGGLYVPCHGGCWKIDGSPCDGDLDSDITRYICFIIENGSNGCTATAQQNCPLFHVLSGSNERVLRNDTARFPYHCYSGHCAPGACDPYSNPGPQELMMLLPCSEWAVHGYPAVEGSTNGLPMELDVGALGARVALSGAEPADVGPALRAQRGWAPLPDLSTLPPYPGWTRSFNGFDFGEEQPSRGLVRYEFTSIDLLVLAA